MATAEEEALGKETLLENQTPTITRSQLSDPSVREIVRANFARQGDTGVFSPVDYTPLRQEELDLAKAELSNLAGAERTVALRDVEKNMQKRGLTFGGQTTEAMVNTSDEIRLKEQAQFIQAQEGILSRYSGYREAERGRQFELASAMIQTETQEQIARIQSDTTLSVAEKEGQIAQLQMASNERIAKLQAETNVTTTGMQVQGAKDVEVIRGEYGVTTTSMTIEGQKIMLGWELNADEQKQMRALKSNELIAFKGYETEMQKAYLSAKTSLEIVTIQDKTSREQFDKQLEATLAQFNLSEENKKTIAREQIAARLAEVKMTTETDRQNVADQLAWAREKGYMDDATTRKIAADKLNKEFEMFNLAQSNDMKKMQAQLDNAEKLALIDATTKKEIASKQINADLVKLNLTLESERENLKASLKSALDLKLIDSNTAKEIASNTLKENARQFNFTSAESIRQFNESLSFSKTQFNLTEKQANEAMSLARDKFKQEVAQWKVTNEQESKKFWATFEEGKRQFDLSNTLALDTLEEQQRQFNITTTQGTTEFWKNYELARDTLTANISDNAEKNRLQSELLDLQRESFQEGIREFNLTTTQGTTEFWANYSIARDTLAFQVGEAEADRILKNDTLKEQARQFNVTTANDMTKYLGTLRATMNQFQISVDEQHWYASESLKLQAAQAEDSDVANWANAMAGLLQSPIMLSLSDEDLKTKTNQLFSKIGDILKSTPVELAFSTKGAQLDVEAIVKEIKETYQI